jgi:hypothetical protein
MFILVIVFVIMGGSALFRSLWGAGYNAASGEMTAASPVVFDLSNLWKPLLIIGGAFLVIELIAILVRYLMWRSFSKSDFAQQAAKNGAFGPWGFSGMHPFAYQRMHGPMRGRHFRGAYRCCAPYWWAEAGAPEPQSESDESPQK